MSGADVLEHLVGVGEAVWRASWQASVLAVLVVAVQLIFRQRIAARWRHAMWMLVLVRLALPVVPSSPVSVFNLVQAKAPVVASAGVAVERAPLPWTTTPMSDAVPPLEASRIHAGSSAKPQAAVVAVQPWSPDLWMGWPQVLAFLWALGAALLALRIAWATWRVSRTLRRLNSVDDPAIQEVLRCTAQELRVRRLPHLLTGEGLFSPALVGFVRPKLLVPRGLLGGFAPSELRLVFLHELAHLKRRDVAINWAATMLTVLHWPNPVAWLAAWRLRLERELACDELVMSRTSDTDRRAYGHTIIKLLETFSRAPGQHPALPAGGVGILEGKAQMKRRITMIAQFAKTSRGWTVVAACLVLTLGLVALTDAVAAEEASTSTKPTVQPTPATQSVTIKSDGVTGVILTTKRLMVETAAAATLEGPPDEEIAKVDPTMRAYRAQLAELKEERERKVRSVGEKHPSIVDLDTRIKPVEKLIRLYGAQRRKEMMQPTKLKTGDLVTVSVMDLVGQGVETVKTARVNGDGMINLPYAGRVKASGLSPRELEKAVANALQEKRVVQNALVVSMPALGESHQLARRPAAGGMPAMAEAIVAEGMGMDAPMMAEGMGMDPAMMDPMMGPEAGMGMYAPPEDPAAKALLSRKLPEVKFDQIPLGEVVDFFRDTLGVNVFVNWRALEAAGIARDEPVTMRLKDVALRDCAVTDDARRGSEPDDVQG